MQFMNLATPGKLSEIILYYSTNSLHGCWTHEWNEGQKNKSQNYNSFPYTLFFSFLLHKLHVVLGLDYSGGFKKPIGELL